MLETDGRTRWEGVRNYQARNNLRLMKPGDFAFIYHSGEDKMILGIAKIVSEAYPDPTSTKGDWSVVDIEKVKPLQRVVSLDEIRNTHGLSVMPLVSQARLSVSPATDAQAEMILKIAKTTL